MMSAAHKTTRNAAITATLIFDTWIREKRNPIISDPVSAAEKPQYGEENETQTQRIKSLSIQKSGKAKATQAASFSQIVRLSNKAL